MSTAVEIPFTGALQLLHVCHSIIFCDDKKLKVCFKVISMSEGNKKPESVIKYTTNKYMHNNQVRFPLAL